MGRPGNSVGGAQRRRLIGKFHGNDSEIGFLASGKR